MKTFNLFNQRILLVLLPSLAPLVSQALGMVMEKRGVQSQATCLVNYGWMDNSVQQSPCYVAGWLLGQCNEGGVLLHPLYYVSVPVMKDVNHDTNGIQIGLCLPIRTRLTTTTRPMRRRRTGARARGPCTTPYKPVHCVKSESPRPFLRE